MKKSDAKDFASTKHKGLPKKVKQEIIKRLKKEGEIHIPQVGSYVFHLNLRKENMVIPIILVKEIKMVIVVNLI